MHRIKLLQIGYFSLITLALLAANFVLGYYSYNLQKNTRGQIMVVAERMSKVASSVNEIRFFERLSRDINTEYDSYIGKEGYTAQSRDNSRAQQLQNLYRQREAQRKAKPQDIKSQANERQKLTVSVPSYLTPFDLVETGTYKGITVAEVQAETEFFRFLEWYNYFYQKYPFSSPEKITMSVLDRNIYGKLPTNIKITGVINIQK